MKNRLRFSVRSPFVHWPQGIFAEHKQPGCRLDIFCQRSRHRHGYTRWYRWEYKGDTIINGEDLQEGAKYVQGQVSFVAAG